MSGDRQEYQRQWREQNREKLRQQRIERYARNKERERARQRAYYAENNERLRAKVREYQAGRREETKAAKAAWVKKDRARNPLRHILRTARARAAATGMEFSITEADLRMPECCPVFGTPFADYDSGGRINRPSIDRIDNSLGYVPGNVRIISLRANVIKRDMTREEARLLYENWDAR